MKLYENYSETFPGKFFFKLGRTVRERGHSNSGCPVDKTVKGDRRIRLAETENRPKEEWRSSWYVLQESCELCVCVCV